MRVVSYKKLWKLMIDKDMRKKDLREAARFSTSTMSKLASNENVSMDVLVKLCNTLDVDISDIMEITPEKTM